MAKKKVEEILPTANVDEIAADIMDSINKQFKDLPDKAANFGDNSMSEVTEWVSTGSTMLDLAISNKPNGGWPVGRITEVYGGEACVTEDTIVEVIIK